MITVIIVVIFMIEYTHALRHNLHLVLVSQGLHGNRSGAKRDSLKFTDSDRN